RIDAEASIVFDTNEAIITPELFHTSDAHPPTSSVLNLPTTVSQDFQVQWAGQDDEGGVGLLVYDVFYSKEGAPFQLWLSATDQTEATFRGVEGVEYSFYSIATDLVGHREHGTKSAEASTVVSNTSSLLDVNLDGVIEWTRDGVLLSYGLHPETSDTFLEDVRLIPAASNRTSAAEIRQHIASLGDQLDFNGDGTLNPGQDGGLILRAMIPNLPDTYLEAPELVPTGSTRTTAEAFRAYLSTLTSAGTTVADSPVFDTRVERFLNGESDDVLADLARLMEPADVNGKDGVSPLDALLVINRLAREDSGLIAATGDAVIYDVNLDGSVSPLDALRVINFIARNRDAEGELPVVQEISQRALAPTPAKRREAERREEAVDFALQASIEKPHPVPETGDKGPVRRIPDSLESRQPQDKRRADLATDKALTELVHGI
ncbi:MAG: dockerin type I domain-containing protein, partial [Planctomycetota bacterium]